MSILISLPENSRISPLFFPLRRDLARFRPCFALFTPQKFLLSLPNAHNPNFALILFFGNFCEQVVDNSWILLSEVRFHFVSLTTQSIYFLLLNHNQLARLLRT